MYEKTTLNNGLTVVTHRMPGRTSASLGVWIKVGARYEKAKINGISHFLEHLLFKGTKRRTCEEVKQSIEGIGGSLNGFTSEEHTCYLAKVPGKYINSAVDVLADMVLNARLSSEDIETERKVILEEIRMYKDLPAHIAHELLTGALWPNQPLGMNIAGEISSISSISAGQLQAFKRRFYELNNTVVAACGNLKHKDFLQECKRHFSSNSNGGINKFAKARLKQTSPRLSFFVKDTKQTHLALGVHGLPRAHPERYILGLLHIILGANMSSRLFREVREERGLAYEIGTSVRFFQDTGAFIVHAGIDSRRLLESLEIILQQLKIIKNDTVPRDEFKRAKEYFIGQLMLALEDTADHMLWLGENHASANKFLYPGEVIRRIKKIKPEELKHLANRILQNRGLNLAVVGALKEKEKKLIKERLVL